MPRRESCGLEGRLLCGRGRGQWAPRGGGRDSTAKQSQGRWRDGAEARPAPDVAVGLLTSHSCVRQDPSLVGVAPLPSGRPQSEEVNRGLTLSLLREEALPRP